ncbi:MAG: squalene/phytoene synthase family protein, partial [Burkholderiales bacterium]
MSIEHYENFPVASLLLPAAERAAVGAIYRFARSADDFADEGELPPAQRLARLDAYRAELRAIARGDPPGEPLFAELGRVVRGRGLPLEPLHHLLDAFSQDVLKTRYADFAELLQYCRRSANPVGRLLLHLFGAATPENLAQSDAVCSA